MLLPIISYRCLIVVSGQNEKVSGNPNSFSNSLSEKYRSAVLPEVNPIRDSHSASYVRSSGHCNSVGGEAQRSQSSAVQGSFFSSSSTDPVPLTNRLYPLVKHAERVLDALTMSKHQLADLLNTLSGTNNDVYDIVHDTAN